MHGEFVLGCFSARDPVVGVVFNRLRPRGLRHSGNDVGQAFVGKRLALLGSLGQCAFAHSLHALESSQRSMDRTVSSSFSFLKQEPLVLGELVEFGPSISAETLKSAYGG